MDARNVAESYAMQRRAWSVDEVAQSHGVSPGLVRLEIARGKLRATRIGRRLIISAEALNDWLQQGQAATAALPERAR